MSADNPVRRWLIVGSRFHAVVVDRLVEGARSCLLAKGLADTEIEVVRVAGAFELPQLATAHVALPPDFRPQGIVAETMALGWGILVERPQRELVMGAVTQPWVADVKFRAMPPAQFATFAGPDLVKIAWTLEVEPINAELTRFRTQTRVLATDDGARKKFRRYWRLTGAGIVLIRWLVNRAIRRESERQSACHRKGRGQHAA